MRQYQGWIEHESQLGTGTVFSVHLPASEGGSAPREIGEKKTSASGTETLLVIDDEAVIRTLLDTQLTSFGYNVLLGTDGEDGLEVFRSQMDKISLVLLDLSMPSLSGREVLPRLRDLNPEIKVIILTGYAADAQQFPDVQAVMQKPFPQKDLVDKVRQVLEA